MPEPSASAAPRNGLLTFLGILRRFWAVALLVFALTVGGAVGYTAMASPTYTSSAQVYIGPPRDSAGSTGGVTLAQQRAVIYAKFATSPGVTGPVVQQTGAAESRDALAEQVEATPVPGTSILEIQVSDSSAAQAREATAATSRELMSFAEQTERQTSPGAVSTFVVVQEADLPDAPSAPQPVRIIGVAVVLGIVLAGGVVLLLHNLRPRAG